MTGRAEGGEMSVHDFSITWNYIYNELEKRGITEEPYKKRSMGDFLEVLDEIWCEYYRKLDAFYKAKEAIGR